MPLNFSRFPLPVRIVERNMRRFIKQQVKDPELAEKLTPQYGLGCKRPSISNHYLRTFNRDNVELVTDEIETITANGVRTADGREREVDVLITATGFRLAFDPENFRTTPVTGRNGLDLAEHYQQNRLKAYESISMPGLPNHFMIFGPYGWTGASWHVLVQTASTHIMRVLEEARRRGATAVEVSEQATDRYHEKISASFNGSVWFTNGCATANSYYFDHHGDVPYMRPDHGPRRGEGRPKLPARRLPLRDAGPRGRQGAGGGMSAKPAAKGSGTKSTPRRYAPRMPAAERRDQLLDATLKLIADQGYEAVSMEAVARQAGVTKPVVYDLFGSLTDLLEALIEREEERALLQLAELMPTPSEGADPEDLMIDGLKAFLASVEARPDAWRVILMPDDAMPGMLREVVQAERRQVASQLESIVRWGVDQLGLEVEDVELLVELIISSSEESARKHLADPERYSIERLTGFTASLLASVKR